MTKVPKLKKTNNNNNNDNFHLFFWILLKHYKVETMFLFLYSFTWLHFCSWRWEGFHLPPSQKVWFSTSHLPAFTILRLRCEGPRWTMKFDQTQHQNEAAELTDILERGWTTSDLAKARQGGCEKPVKKYLQSGFQTLCLVMDVS